MKKVIKCFAQMFMTATFVIGALISSGACQHVYYQPKVPEKLRSRE